MPLMGLCVGLVLKVVLLGDGGTCKRWGLVGGFNPLGGYPPRELSDSGLFLFLSFVL
jgi:hypothetical protein